MKTAMITGLPGGIGLATAVKFLDEGYIVCGMGRRAPEDFGDASFVLERENFRYFRGDVASHEDRLAFLEYALSINGSIDVLVNVAGIAPRVRADLLEMTEESYDTVMATNTKATMFLTQAVANRMKENEAVNGIRGYICNTSSLSAYAVSVNRGEYCISKAGVSMVTSLFAERLAEFGIPVNEVRPGIIETNMTAKVKEKYDGLIAGGLLPMARWGQPEDIAAGIYALCSGALPYVTGQSLDVDGGFHIRKL
ncbi:MAG: 3-ketoacyl-ACP reductase [Clostridia bacterium]|nr:3-ketoacyl-ACP reductase [Clostridia bacterium]